MPVIAPADIPMRETDIVVIGSMSREPIRHQLLARGVPIDLTIAGLTTEFTKNNARFVDVTSTFGGEAQAERDFKLQGEETSVFVEPISGRRCTTEKVIVL